MSSPAPAILRLPQALAQTGDSRSTHYLKIIRGLMTQPVRLGERAVGWPKHEIDAILNARIAGKSDEEIRDLVVTLEVARKAAA